jgi:pimeloyl-ACP methyl ester carboxylesterase
LFDPDDARTHRIVAALEGHGDPDDNLARKFVQYASQPGNDIVALTAVMKRPRPRLRPEMLATATCPTLVVIGDRDFAGPGQPLVDALPDATLRTLPNVDHFATPEAFGFIDAALEFLDAIPW